MIPSYIFYFLAFLAVMFAILVISAKNPIHSCLYLVLTMFTIAANYVLLNAQFLAVVQMIVYAGAIMVLFLFTIMLLNLNSSSETMKSNLVKFSSAIVGGTILLLLTASLHKSMQISSLTNDAFQNPILNNAPMQFPNHSNIGLIKNLGQVLFTQYVFPFEIISILILSAMIGAVVLGRKEKSNVII
jgi:NADH-quinone oxidoreductase subunit J